MSDEKDQYGPGIITTDDGLTHCGLMDSEKAIVLCFMTQVLKAQSGIRWKYLDKSNPSSVNVACFAATCA